MTREEAIWYLEPICNSASLVRYREALGLAIAALREQEEHRWIPVTERLPTESDGTVLVCLANKWPHNEREAYINAKHDRRVRTGNYCEFSGNWYDGHGGTLSEVIGWMPMPTPLKDT